MSAKASAALPVPADSMRSSSPELPSFQFHVTYDLASVQAASRTLFRSYWRARSARALGSLIAVLFSIGLESEISD